MERALPCAANSAKASSNFSAATNSDIARYLYLPRMRDEDVLLGAVLDGVSQLNWRLETFAYAEGFDEQRNRYQGLRAGQAIRPSLDGQNVLVKPEIAAAQLAADEQQRQADSKGQRTEEGGAAGQGEEQQEHKAVGIETIVKLSRFHGSVPLDPVRLGRDAGRIAEEVVQHLTSQVDAQVEVTLEIQAKLPEGASEKLVRDVTENCRTLRFNNYGFEEA